MIDVRRVFQCAAPNRVIDDRLHGLLIVAERFQGLGHGTVDNLEIATAGELLELHQRKVGLDAGRVAIHDQADRARRRNHGRLRVAITICRPSSKARSQA